MTDREIVATLEEFIDNRRPEWADKCRFVALASEQQAQDTGCKRYVLKFLLNPFKPDLSLCAAADYYWRTILDLARQQGLCYSLTIASNAVAFRESGETVVWRWMEESSVRPRQFTPLAVDIERNILNPDIWVTMDCWIRVGRAQ